MLGKSVTNEHLSLLCTSKGVEKSQNENKPSHVALVSLARQQNMLEAALACDESDFMDTQDFGLTVQNYLQQITSNTKSISQAVKYCDLRHLLNQPFRLLSR